MVPLLDKGVEIIKIRALLKSKLPDIFEKTNGKAAKIILQLLQILCTFRQLFFGPYEKNIFSPQTMKTNTQQKLRTIFDRLVM